MKKTRLNSAGLVWISIISSNSYADGHAGRIPSNNSEALPGIMMGIGIDNKPTYMISGVDGELRSISPEVVGSMMASAFETAKLIACKQKGAAPDSFSVTLGLLSASWETSKICTKNGGKK